MKTAKFKIIPRIRKLSPSASNNLRLHRAEFGDKISKNYDIEKYYPDTNILLLALSKFFNIKKEFITVGLGAEGLIKDIYLTNFLKKKKTKILTTSPNFFMYKYYAKLFNFNYNEIEVIKKNKQLIKKENLISQIKNKKINFLILVNPSSPIEKIWSKSELIFILNFCKKKKILVLIDQVYNYKIKFDNLNLIKKYKNLLLLGSFSKMYGLPGLRSGFCFANKRLTEEINTCRLAIELPAKSIEKSIYMLKNNGYLIKKNIKQVISATQYARAEFKKLKIETFNTRINSLSFLLDKKNLLQYMKKEKIFLNNINTKYFKNFYNITTTNKKNLKIFFIKLKKFLNE